MNEYCIVQLDLLYKLYLKKKTPLANQLILFVFLSLTGIAMYLGILFKMEMKS